MRGEVLNSRRSYPHKRVVRQSALWLRRILPRHRIPNLDSAWAQSRIGGCNLTKVGDPFLADGVNQIAKLHDRGELERQIVGVHIIVV